jgi:hypothetical protein
MIIRGRFIGDAPYFSVYLKSTGFEGFIRMLADTGASRTTLLDRDVKLLGIEDKYLEPSSLPIVGIGGSVRSFLIKDVEFIIGSDDDEFVHKQDLWIAQHDLNTLPPDEVSRIMRIPSVLGRDIMNRFRFLCDYQSGIVRLER